MFKKLLAGLFILFFFIFQASNVLAIDEGDECKPKDLKFPRHGCDEPFFCITNTEDTDRGNCGELIEEGDDCNPDAINQDCKAPNFCIPNLADEKRGNCGELIEEGDDCNPKAKNPRCAKPDILFCKPNEADTDRGNCEVDTNKVPKVFGKIEPPPILKEFLAKNPTGASAISQFLSNFVSLLFTIAMIALIFMILWAAFDWLTSGGDKEKLAAAQRRLLHAFIGILLFAVAFAIIKVLGTFTGFSFFAGT